MKYIKENKELLFKYFLVLISNILIYFICDFYFASNKYIFMMVIAIIVDLIIYYYMGTKVFKYYLDFIVNFIVGCILIFLINDKIDYSSAVFSLVFANNIVFIRSRLSDKFIKESIQYLLMLIYSILCLFLTNEVIKLMKNTRKLVFFFV